MSSEPATTPTPTETEADAEPAAEPAAEKPDASPSSAPAPAPAAAPAPSVESARIAKHAIAIRDLTVRAGDRTLLREASLEVSEGEVVLLIGQSGSGKSTLLNILTGLDDGRGAIRSTGSIRVRGREILPGAPPASGEPQTEDDHTPVGIVFQECALFDDLTVEQNLAFALDHRRDRERRADLRGRLAAFIAEQGIDPGADVRRLSGGQKQRVAIARTLAFDPDIIAFDEPTSGLDPASRADVMSLILETRKAFGVTSLIVTHDYALASQADRVVVIEGEKLVEHATTDDLAALMTRSEKPKAADAGESAKPAEPPPTGKPPIEPPPPHPASAWMAASPLLVLWQLLQWFLGTLAATGTALIALAAPAVALTPLDAVLPGRDAAVRPGVRLAWLSPWWWRYLFHYLRLLLVGSAIPYMLIAGAILGYVATHFTFTFLPRREIIEPLILDDVLPGLGFALFRIIVPVVATLLLAARNGAAITSDVGNRSYGRQALAMRSLGASPRGYLLGPSFCANLIAFVVLNLVCFYASEVASGVVLGFTIPDMSPDYWASHFGRRLGPWGVAGFGDGTGWVFAKVLVCGAGVAAAAYACGTREMRDAAEVSRATTRSIILATVFVLLVHFVFAFIEFDPPSPEKLPWLK